MRAHPPRILSFALFSLLAAQSALAQDTAVILSEDIRPDVTSGAENLTQILAGFGITAETRIPAPGADPGDLSDATCVFDLRVDYALDFPSQARLAQAATNGSGIYFAGEHSVFAFRNDSVAAFIDNLGGGPVVASPIGFPTPTPEDIPEPTNPDHAAATTCNAVDIVTYDGVANGHLSSTGTGVWLTGDPLMAGGAAWDEGSLVGAPEARFAFVLDINYISTTDTGTLDFTEADRTVPTENRAFVENLVQFLCTRGLECECAPFNHGWWHRVCLGTDQIDPGRNGQGNGPDEHPDRPINGQVFTGADAAMAPHGILACQALDEGPFSDERLAALRELATIHLNLQARFLTTGCPVELHPVEDGDGLTVRDAIAFMEQRLADGSRRALREARWIGEHVNNREALR
jgi:hypothetical protein